MTFTIITHVPHIKQEKQFFAYAPYVREMNIWLKHVDEVIIVAPKHGEEITAIDLPYQHKNIQFVNVPLFDITSISHLFLTLVRLPKLFYRIFNAMQKADHIHLRCPGNMGLLGCLVQILFPKKTKTAKYAGNWDPKSSQPWSYKLQKWVLSNPFLTKNMQVLVYGEWPHQTKNIKPFFTASFSEKEIPPYQQKPVSKPIVFSFIGTFSPGKRPLYAVQLVQQLHQKGEPVQLHMYGEGILFQEVKAYVKAQHLGEVVIFHGNQPREVIKEHLQTSHFLVLPSQSEGWPKVVAEAMCFSSLPLVTPVSCVPYMLDYGKRGALLTLELEEDVEKILYLLKNPEDYYEKVKVGYQWSKEFTMECFEMEIRKLLTNMNNV